MSENNKQEVVLKVGREFGGGYSSERLQSILDVLQHYDLDSVKEVAKEILITSRKLPLRDEWIEGISKAGVSGLKREIANCLYCNGTSFLEAIFLGSLNRDDYFGNPFPDTPCGPFAKTIKSIAEEKEGFLNRQDAMGNVWPLVITFACTCSNGAMIKGQERFTSSHTDYFWVLKYGEDPYLKIENMKAMYHARKVKK